MDWRRTSGKMTARINRKVSRQSSQLAKQASSVFATQASSVMDRLTALLEREGRRHDGVGVRVLGLQVPEHLGVVPLAQPVVGIHAPVAVGFQDSWPLRRERRFGRREGCLQYPVESRRPSGTRKAGRRPPGLAADYATRL